MRQVTKYTEAIKASVLSKALAPNGPGVIELAKEFNIPKATIYTWLINMKNKNNNKEDRDCRYCEYLLIEGPSIVVRQNSMITSLFST